MTEPLQLQADTTSPLAGLIAPSRIIVMLGSGGVGKTTTSIMTALMAAQMGRRVALLSIDPARRLAAALGIPLSDRLRPILMPPDVRLPGSVDAAILDQKAVFDAMVSKHAPSMETAERILAHPVYQAASTNLAGPLEYMALAKLEELANNPDYDLLVLDTPPDTQALDFLTRPNVLAGFMENRVITWLIRPFIAASHFGLSRLFSAGERMMGGIAKVTGISALQNMGEFLLLIQEVIQGFHKSGEHIVEMLHRESTAFTLVTAPTEAAVRSSRGIVEELDKSSYLLKAVIFNRCLPKPVIEQAQLLATQHPALAMLSDRANGELRLISNLREAINKKLPNVVYSSLDDDPQPIGNLKAILSLGARLQRH
ncbi:MAG: ArsA family ATPase [Deltaproteobacteria bacterium]|nr:ArsA family ATPase [Deltaproteobacteria bacterium]